MASYAFATFRDRQKRSFLFLMIVVALLVCATIVIDSLFAVFHNTSFYLSESFLFSTFWLLFLPLLHLQRVMAERRQSLLSGMFVTIFAAVLHLLGYPAVIWLLSKAFYDHSFAYLQTLIYGVTTYSLPTLILYGLSFLIFRQQKKQSSSEFAEAQEKKVATPTAEFVRTLLVPDGNNKRTIIETKDILYFSANSPYVNIFHSAKKFLHTETLASLQSQLDGNQFVRIHKSFIVNIEKVVSYQSRLNGDYDLTLCDGTLLRLSRSYASHFKARFQNSHRLTAK